MNLSKLLRTLYDNRTYDMTDEYLHLIAFRIIRKNIDVDIESAKAVLFLEKGKVCYRSSFYQDGAYIVNNYGFKQHEDDVIFYDGNPKELKEVLRIFIKKLLAGEINDEFFGEYQTGNAKKPVNNLEEAYKISAARLADSIDKDVLNKGKSKMKGVLDKMLEVNKESAVRSAKLEVGKAANQLVLEKLTPRLPMMVRGYADSPIAELVVGNVVAGLLIQFAPDNEKAQVLSEAMIAAGVQVAIESFDIPELVNELLNNVDISGLAE